MWGRREQEHPRLSVYITNRRIWCAIGKEFKFMAEKIKEKKIINLVANAIEDEDYLRKNGSVRLENATITKLERIEVFSCNNPNTNFSFSATGTIRIDIKTANGDDFQEFPNCEISGFVMINDDKAIIVNGISIDKGFPNFITIK